MGSILLVVTDQSHDYYRTMSNQYEITYVDPHSLQFREDNRNQHTPEQIDRLAQIIQHNGFRVPVIVSQLSQRVVAGHGRLMAAKKLKLEKVPVIYQQFESEDEEFQFHIADNAIAAWAELDLSGINADLEKFGPFDIDLLGIKDFVIEPAEKIGMCDEDDVPDVGESFVKEGDIWILGEHRLMCGDSTKIDNVEKLMGGEQADLIFTDPPYGVSYADKNAFLNSIAFGKRIQKRIENDHMTPDQMNEFWFTVLSNLHMVTSDKSSYYICSPQGGDLMMMMSIIRAGWQLKHMLIWVKNNHVLGRCDYNYKHEPILYGWKEDGTHEFFGNGRCKTSVWDFNKPLKNDLHPTMKPVELCEEAIQNSSKAGQIIIDLFGGSGSTLIACEKTNRKCFMMEIDKHYCGVIIERWQNFTGKKAVLDVPNLADH